MQSKIFPAIDIIDGKCVRLSKGDYDTKKIYDENPLEVAQRFEAEGATYLHVVDLDAAKNPNFNNRPIIEQIIKKTNLKVQVGGGIRSRNDVDSLLKLGAYRLIIGSKAVTDRVEVFEWIKLYGKDAIVIGADVNNNRIATHGWLNVTDEDVFDFIKSYMDHGGETFLCTDISKDGMMSGSSIQLYLDIMHKCAGVKIIASGGVHNMEEVRQLQEVNMDSIIIGKAIYEGAIDVAVLFSSKN